MWVPWFLNVLMPLRPISDLLCRRASSNALLSVRVEEERGRSRRVVDDEVEDEDASACEEVVEEAVEREDGSCLRRSCPSAVELRSLSESLPLSLLLLLLSIARRFLVSRSCCLLRRRAAFSRALLLPGRSHA